MKIGELAQAAQCTVETVRYYEKERLLFKPDRNGNNYRLYGTKHLERLQLIRNCRALDMSLKEIHALVNFIDHPSTDCTSVNLLLDEHIIHVNIRLQELTDLKTQLVKLRKKCRNKQKNKECGILHELSVKQFQTKKTSSTHLG